MPQIATSWPWASFWSSTTICWTSSRVGARMIACGPSASGFEHLDQGDAEGGGLAGARLGLADDVVAVEGLGDQLGLDGRRGEIADLLQGPEHGWAQAHRLEPGRGVLHGTLDQTNLLYKVEMDSARPSRPGRPDFTGHGVTLS